MSEAAPHVVPAGPDEFDVRSQWAAFRIRLQMMLMRTTAAPHVVPAGPDEFGIDPDEDDMFDEDEDVDEEI